MPRNPLRVDPTRTTLLRRRFAAEMRGRFGAFKAELFKWLVTEDELGLVENAKTYQFATSDKKLSGFLSWMESATKQKILTVDKGATPWTSKYVSSAYRTGVVRSYAETLGKRAVTQGSSEFAVGAKTQFLRQAFSSPESMSKVKLLGTRTYEELKGVTATMSQKLSRGLAQGLAEGKAPTVIARELANEIDSLTRARAEVIARTEIIYAHAEGQLDAMGELGIEGVTADVEFTTADDNAVCPECQDLEGKEFTLEEARGIIPVHPNCRCSWMPASSKPRAEKVTRNMVFNHSRFCNCQWS